MLKRLPIETDRLLTMRHRELIFHLLSKPSSTMTQLPLQFKIALNLIVSKRLECYADTFCILSSIYFAKCVFIILCRHWHQYAWKLFNLYISRNIMHAVSNMSHSGFMPLPERSAGASSNRIVRSSVCPSVCLSVVPSHLHIKCNI